MAHNYAAALVEYTRGTPITDIAMALAIPLDALKNKIRTESWAKLAADIQVAVVPTGKRAERDMAKIEANRAKNLALAEKLQQDLANIVDRLLAGELTFKTMTAKGEQVELEPDLKDRKVLSEYARNVAEMTYRALGDSEKPGVADGPGGGAGGPTLIQINLPAPVAAPRQDRPESAQVLDVAAIATIGKRLSDRCDPSTVSSIHSANGTQTLVDTEVE